MNSIKNKLSFFSLLFLTPVFISFSKDGLFTLDRSGGYEDHIWFITIPISILFVFFLVLKHVLYILNKSFFIILLLYLVLIFVTKIIYSGVDYQFLKIAIFMLVFVSTSYAFKEHFDQKISIKNVNYAEIYYFYLPVSTILFLSLIGFYFLGLSKDSFIINQIKVYNYAQYFGYIFVLLLGTSSRSNYLFFFTLPFVLLIAYITRNDTALILSILLTLYFICDKLIHSSRRVLFKNYIFYSLIAIALIYFIYMLFLREYFPIPNASIFDSFYFRGVVIDKFINQFQIIQIFYPYIDSGKVVNSSLHNEYLEILKVSGLIGFFLYYYFIVSRFKGFSEVFRVQSIAFILVILLGGLVVEPSLHLYTAIILSYFAALYCSISNTISYDHNN
jgi:hypothetical protein